MCFANWFLGRIVRSVPWLKSLLLETPSGFAVFSIDASLMDKENAVEVRMDAVDRLGFNNSSNFFCPIDDFTYWLLISCFYLCSTFGPTSSRTIWQKILLVHLPPLFLCAYWVMHLVFMLKLFVVAVPLFVTRGDYILTVEMALVGIVRLNSVWYTMLNNLCCCYKNSPF
jgi:hypothetical protein